MVPRRAHRRRRQAITAHKTALPLHGEREECMNPCLSADMAMPPLTARIEDRATEVLRSVDSIGSKATGTTAEKVKPSAFNRATRCTLWRAAMA
jgi:hypothetical protein